MAITSTSTVRVGNVTVVTVVSNLIGTVYYHWYLDGAYMGQTTAPSFSFSLGAGEQARIDVVDTLDAGFDPLAAPPAFFPGRYTIHWVRSLSGDVQQYVVEQRIGTGGDPWTEITRVPHNVNAWDYQLLSGKLVDLTAYDFRVRSADGAGNVEAGGLAQMDVNVVRVPDAPNWTFTYNPATDRVTFAAA